MSTGERAMTASERWEAMTARERDDWIAEHVMKWEREPEEQHPGANVAWFKPDAAYRRHLVNNSGTTILATTALPFSAAAAADYLVLCRVRETWTKANQCLFGDVLRLDIWLERMPYLTSTEPEPWCWYQPGDYSAAAYLLLTQETL